MILSGSKAIPTCMDVGVAKTVITVNILQDFGMSEVAKFRELVSLNLEKVVSTMEWWDRTEISWKDKGTWGAFSYSLIKFFNIS